jgi:O-antigen/teichoic acid export membrane protein
VTTDPDGSTAAARAGTAGLLMRGGLLRAASYLGMIGLSVISVTVLTRYLGVGRFGRYTTVMSLVAGVAAITDAGMSGIGIREYSTLAGEPRDTLMRELLGLRVTLTLIGSALVTAFAVAAGYSFALVIGAAVASLANVALVYQHTLSIPLYAQLRLGLISALDLARQAVWVATIVALSAIGVGVGLLLASPLLSGCAVLAMTAVLVRARPLARASLKPGRWSGLLRATIVFSLASAAGTLYVYAAQVLTSLIATRVQSGLFAASFRVFIVCAGLPGLLAGATLSVLAVAARDDEQQLDSGFQSLFELALVGGVGSALLLHAGARFVVVTIGGGAYQAAAPVLGIQSFALIGSFLVAPASFGLLALRRHRGLLAANAAALVVGIALTLWLASAHGAKGAAIATVCGETTLAVGTVTALGWRRLDLRPTITVAIKVVGAGVCAGAASLIPTMPSVVRLAVALGVYGGLIVFTDALPVAVKTWLSGAARAPESFSGD